MKRVRFYPILILIMSLLGQHVKSQNKSESPKNNLFSKWLKACLNLEARPNFLASKTFVEWQQKLRRGEHIDKQNALKIQQDYRMVSYSATGILLLYKNKHYLVTARHFLVDDSAAIKNTIFEKIYIVDNGSRDVLSNKPTVDTTPDVHYLDGYTSGPQVRYVISDPLIDIGIIAIDDIPFFGGQFIAALYSRGYRPINFSDIDTTDKLSEKNKLYAIGYPDELSKRKDLTKKISLNAYYWQSPWVTIPIVSTGYVKKPYPGIYFFTGNIFIYHGFSGGPVISNNKLVGINNSYGGLLSETTSDSLNYYGDEYSLFIKSYNMLPLLKELEKRFPPISKPHPINKNYKKTLSTVISGAQVIVIPN